MFADHNDFPAEHQQPQDKVGGDEEDDFEAGAQRDPGPRDCEALGDEEEQQHEEHQGELSLKKVAFHILK